MIALTCKHCKQTLEIDDAFAGGVCRCSNCGTMQTVPSQKPAARRPRPSPPTPIPPTPIPPPPILPAPIPRQVAVDELPSLQAQTAQPDAGDVAPSVTKPLIVTLGIVLLVVLITIAWIALRRG